ncbi:MAG: tRNA uridine-5-carboxymethylaminomethyl(34) synthesis GTPase MnmE [Desulfobacteraceae bacterium]
MQNDTIAAISTPLGSGGIGVVRLSGPQAISVVQRLFVLRNNHASPATRMEAEKIVSHHMQLGTIQDPHTESAIDEVLMVVMKGPRSYTREDVVEIQSHAGYVVLSRILGAVLDAGARLAEPGEFTKRAFLNGRIDLSQAEAVAEMISAKTEAGVQLAAAHLTGGLRSAVLGFMDAITKVQVALEAGIEFPDEVESNQDRKRLMAILNDCVNKPIEALLRQYDGGHFFRDGIRLGIVGRPNVGKSSLLNRLLNKEKAIVTPIPGTTRDLVEDQITISGIPVWITDTAGLHRTEDPIEVIGMQKTRENLCQADLVLWVVDGEQGITDEDIGIREQIEGRNTVLVVNKLDLFQGRSSPSVPEVLRGIDSVFVSAKFGLGIDQLKELIRNKCLTDVDIDPGRSIVPNLRQKSALDTALVALGQAVEGLAQNMPDELIASDLMAAKNALGVITGEHIDGDVLDQIFDKFCIGK